MRVSPLHLLSDFDGVWTDPARELEAVHDTVVSELARLDGVKRAEIEEVYAEFCQQILNRPQDFGWLIEGRMSSYVDEDFFAMPTAVGQFIDEASCSLSVHLREAILREWPDVMAFLDHCYHSTCDRFRALNKHDLAPGAERVLGWMLDHGITICFATNAPAAKVIDWFAHHDFDVVDAREVAPGEAPLRVYGRAGKQWLSKEPEAIEVGGRSVQVDRPQYRAILERECPDAVVGDVFSLDLSLPAALRAQGAAAAPQAIGLMHMRHTPAWLQAAVGPQSDGWIDWLVPHVTALPRLLAGIEARSRPAVPGRR
ncbi:MAG: hypothetical protein MK209_06270 [Planctomycetes bacterium]|nr:hypothetical protein [Planctomycetota bacterium]